MRRRQLYVARRRLIDWRQQRVLLKSPIPGPDIKTIGSSGRGGTQRDVRRALAETPPVAAK